MSGLKNIVTGLGGSGLTSIGWFTTPWLYVPGLLLLALAFLVLIESQWAAYYTNKLARRQAHKALRDFEDEQGIERIFERWRERGEGRPHSSGKANQRPSSKLPRSVSRGNRGRRMPD